MASQRPKRKRHLTERGSQYEQLRSSQRRHQYREPEQLSTSSMSSAHPSRFSDESETEDEVNNAHDDNDESGGLVRETPPREAEPNDDDWQPILGSTLLEETAEVPFETPELDNDDGDSEDSDIGVDLHINGAPRVKFTSKFRALNGSSPIAGSMTTREHTNRTLTSSLLFDWANDQVNKQLPLPVKYTSVSAYVYLLGQSRPHALAETIVEDDDASFSRFLVCLQKKKKEERLGKKRRDVMVDFDLHFETVLPPSHARSRAQTTQSGASQSTQRPRQSATQRALDDLPNQQEDLRMVAGSGLAVLTQYWRCSLNSCWNIHNMCWVDLREGERLPGRVERHYPVPNKPLEKWLDDINNRVCTIEDPSERVRALLRQYRERSVNSKQSRGMQHQQMVELQQQELDKLSRLQATIESLTELYTAKSVAEISERQRAECKKTPINSGKPAWEQLRAFFQFWYDHDGLKDPYSLYIVSIGRKMTARRHTLEELRHPSVLTSLKWTRDYRWPLLVLDRMRRRIREFIEHDSWETWFGTEHGWEVHVFEPDRDGIEREQLSMVAQDGLAMMGVLDVGE